MLKCDLASYLYDTLYAMSVMYLPISSSVKVGEIFHYLI
uniref:Uncharacterized protein n=1 Tax=Rhizophora mucronata TaxID=61149 RepID=A0A2P2PQT4_RHIMU